MNGWKIKKLYTTNRMHAGKRSARKAKLNSASGPGAERPQPGMC